MLKKSLVKFSVGFNPITTNDAIWCRLTLKIGSVLAKKVGRFQHRVPCTWQLPWLAREKPLLALARLILTLLAQTGSGTNPLPL